MSYPEIWKTSYTPRTSIQFMSRMRYGVFMIEKIQMVCWDISGNLTSGYQRFRGTHCPHLQGKYWRYVTEKCWYRLAGHMLTSKKDYNLCLRLYYNAIHIAICVLNHGTDADIECVLHYHKTKKRINLSTRPLHMTFSVRQIFFDFIHQDESGYERSLWMSLCGGF
jgi:hypothetical protein